MNYTSYLDQVANKFQTLVQNVPICSPIYTEDFGWTNCRYESELFRMAHIERYSDDKIEVLHFTTFPHSWSPEPIFGFDVICTGNKVTGAYMDLSPTLLAYQFDDIELSNRKPLPEWATVFSKHFILFQPQSDDEFIRFCEWTLDKYKWYLHELLSQGVEVDPERVISKQNEYCKVQASNPRTFSVLKTKLGEYRAKYFMQEILFPKIKQ